MDYCSFQVSCHFIYYLQERLNSSYFYENNWHKKITEDEMVEACSTERRDLRTKLLSENLENRDAVKDLGVDWKIKLRQSLNRHRMRLD
jgi:hypothetical protein